MIRFQPADTLKLARRFEFNYTSKHDCHMKENSFKIDKGYE